MKMSISRSQVKICKYHSNRVVNVALKIINDDIDVKLYIKIDCKFVKIIMMMLMKM